MVSKIVVNATQYGTNSDLSGAWVYAFVPGIDVARSFHWLLLSPSQWPEYLPWLGNVEREMMKGRFPVIFLKALRETDEHDPLPFHKQKVSKYFLSLFWKVNLKLLGGEMFWLKSLLAPSFYMALSLTKVWGRKIVFIFLEICIKLIKSGIYKVTKMSVSNKYCSF